MMHDTRVARSARRCARRSIRSPTGSPGRIDASSGEITIADLADPGVDEVFDDLGEIVLKKVGEVIVVPSDRTPTTFGAAAIYRF
jgi:hypothetical protein